MNVSFIIPFHNEDENCTKMIERVIDFAKESKLSYEIIPIDDRSIDATGEILNKISRKYKTVIPLRRNKDSEEAGNTMGKALILGSKKAKGKYIIWTMGDMADDTKTYKDILNKLEKGADLVFGSRYMPGGSRGNLEPIKAFLSSWGTILARFLFDIPVHDITNAFRGFKREVFEKIRLDSAGFSISPEFAIKAHLAGFKLGEAPTVYTDRVKGLSNFKLFKMTKSYLSLFFSLFWKYKILRKPLDFIKIA